MNFSTNMFKNQNNILHPTITSKKQDESGRSMVEILGVLAIIGVLSIGGIAGYTYAMNKRHANELFNEANQRATVISGQIMFGNAPSLSEFERQNFGYAFIDNNVYNTAGTATWSGTDKSFALKLTNVNKYVCQNLKGMVGDIVQGFSPSDCQDNATVLLMYNNDLTPTEIEKSDANEADCSAYPGTKSSNQGGFAGLADDDVSRCNCPLRHKWNTETSTCEALGENECISYTAQECPSGQFCSFDDSASCDGCSDIGGGTCSENIGTCKPLTNGTNVSAITDGFDGLLTGTQMNWWTANSWCIAHGMQIPSLAEFGCTPNDSKVSGWDCDWGRFKASGRLASSNWWVSNDPDCRARNLNVPNSSVDFDTPKKERWYSTLCTRGRIQEEVFSQEGEYCLQTSDCVPGLFCNSEHRCQQKLDDGENCTASETCKSGHCGQNGSGSDVCFTSCTSYTSQECESGYYCAFNYPHSCTESGTGACMPIINGSTLTAEVDVIDGLFIPKTMNWWSANSLCIAHNKRLVSLADFGCNPEPDPDCDDWNKFFKNGSHFRNGVSWWVSNLYTSCVGYNITTNGSRVDRDTHLDNKTYYNVVCK